MKLQRIIGIYRLQNEHWVSIRTEHLFFIVHIVRSHHQNPLSLSEHVSAIETKIPASSRYERLMKIMIEDTLSEIE